VGVRLHPAERDKRTVAAERHELVGIESLVVQLRALDVLADERHVRVGGRPDLDVGGDVRDWRWVWAHAGIVRAQCRDPAVRPPR
jgi:hypothetical protein